MMDLKPVSEAYRAYGLVHTPKIVPPDLCDQLVDAWRREVKPYAGLLKRQDSLQEEVHRRSADGFVVNPLWNVHRLDAFPGFSSLVPEIVDKTPVRACANAALGWPARLMQSAFFESSDGTAAHRDDAPYATDDGMVGAWIALEDITLEAGPFVLWTGSRDWELPELDALGRSIRKRLGEGDPDVQADAAEYHRRLAERLAEQEPIVATIGKGDVVWWDRRVFHGSLSPQVGAARSRMSLVLHFVPAGVGL